MAPCIYQPAQVYENQQKVIRRQMRRKIESWIMEVECCPTLTFIRWSRERYKVTSLSTPVSRRMCHCGEMPAGNESCCKEPVQSVEDHQPHDFPKVSSPATASEGQETEPQQTQATVPSPHKWRMCPGCARKIWSKKILSRRPLERSPEQLNFQFAPANPSFSLHHFAEAVLYSFES